MKKKIIFIILLILFWMFIIFIFSDMSSSTSNSGSIKIIKFIVDKVNYFNYKIGISNRYSDKESMIIARGFNYPFRKLMHISEYLVLCTLIIFLLHNFKMRYFACILISFSICFLYACFDEYHQSLLDRTGVFKDVLIDCFGAYISCFMYYIFLKFRLMLKK